MRGHLPAINLWYAKLAIDQAMLNQMQEAISPGYLSKVRQRAHREWDASYWWKPQDSGILSDRGMEGPQRAPELTTAVGGP